VAIQVKLQRIVADSCLSHQEKTPKELVENTKLSFISNLTTPDR